MKGIRLLIPSCYKPSLAILVVLLILVIACGQTDTSQGTPETLYFSGIPDQDVSSLARRYSKFAEYMSEQLGLDVKFKPSIDYAAVVTAFEMGDIQLGWFGGLTGVQARLRVPNSLAIAQRPRDQQFHSKVVVQADLPVQTITDLKGLSSTKTFWRILRLTILEPRNPKSHSALMIILATASVSPISTDASTSG